MSLSELSKFITYKTVYIYFRNWNECELGFGNLSGNIWLGLNYIHQLLKAEKAAIRVYLEDFDGISRYAHYSSFKIADAADMYRLSVSNYSDTAGDSMTQRNQQQYTTTDNDNDVHDNVTCTYYYEGAWWYAAYHASNLNGRYYVHPKTQMITD